MAKKKEETAVKNRYPVLIPCSNDKREFVPNTDYVTTDDFSQAVIDNWRTITPPVLGEPI